MLRKLTALLLFFSNLDQRLLESGSIPVIVGVNLVVIFSFCPLQRALSLLNQTLLHHNSVVLYFKLLTARLLVVCFFSVFYSKFLRNLVSRSWKIIFLKSEFGKQCAAVTTVIARVLTLERASSSFFDFKNRVFREVGILGFNYRFQLKILHSIKIKRATSTLRS